MISTAPRQTAGIRGGQRRTWMPAQPIILLSEAAREVVEFRPQGETVLVLKMWMSISGAWSEHVPSTMRHVLPIAAARKVWRMLRKAGYR
jgi:hypothetical protein